MFSKACEYGIRASIYIGHHSELGLKVRLKAVAKAIDSPEAFTAKILQALARHRVLISSKGPTGGYEIAKGENEVSLFDIVRAVDGDEAYRSCALGLSKCDENKPCPLHAKFVDIRTEMMEVLLNTTIHDLSRGVEMGDYYLKR